MDSGQEVDFTIVLAGKGGSGKSTLLQNLLGEKISDDVTTYPSTEEVVARVTTRDGVRIRIVNFLKTFIIIIDDQQQQQQQQKNQTDWDKKINW